MVGGFPVATPFWWGGGMMGPSFLDPGPWGWGGPGFWGPYGWGPTAVGVGWVPNPPFVPFVPAMAPPPIVDLPLVVDWNPPRDPASAGRDTARLLTVGDRLFRAGDLRRADERYAQAAESDPASGDPHFRRAQVAIRRADYRGAVAFLRQAVHVDPGWSSRAGDIQASWGEPSEFLDALGALEAHLQSDPSDRDGWLLLGAERLYTNRVSEAHDLLLRLSDDPDDACVAALLTAARARSSSAVRDPS